MNRHIFTRLIEGKALLPAMAILISAPLIVAQPDNACHPRRYGKFSEWSKPVNLGPVVNASGNDQWPAISPNGLSLYFGSNRPGGLGNQDIYVTHRVTPDAAWGPPQSLGPNINTEFRDNAPVLSSDGHWLIFSSARVTGRCSDQSGNDIYISHRVLWFGNTPGYAELNQISCSCALELP